MANQCKNHEAIYKLKLNKASTEQASNQKGRHFLVISRKIVTGLPAVVVALFSNGSKCSNTNRFLGCLSVVFTTPSSTSKLRTTAFCILR